jgi:hypothetical protein
MAISAGIPITTTAQAKGRIATLDFQTHVEQIIERACQVLPELESIQVNTYDRYDLGDSPGLCIDLYSRQLYDRRNQTERDLIKWLVREFPPQVLQSLIVDYHPGQGRCRVENS